ncbi:hypothetical protein RZS08_48400, partial [Arthrospira platensis SPKY1]|nr:hypothetical protein [Arthrospira platensis SPKY1]
CSSDLAIGINSCTKDIGKIDDQSELNTQWRSDMPAVTVINGMLHFDTYEDFGYTINYLKNLEQDTFIVKASYQQLGVNLENEPTENITDYPVCRLFENDMIGYLSM